MSGEDKLDTWYRNAKDNADLVQMDFTDWVDKVRVQRKETVVIFASGASLMLHEDKMPAIAKSCLTVCGPTTLPWFVRHAGRQPDLVMNVDKSETLPAMCMEWGDHNTDYLLSPICHTDWRGVKGDLYWFLNLIQGEDGHLMSHPFSLGLSKFFYNIDTKIAQMGCVTNEAIWLVFLALAQLRARRIVLAGCDYSFWRGYARVPVNPTEAYPKMADDIDPQPDGFLWDGIQTNKRMINYKLQLMMVWRHHLMPIYTMSSGMLSEFPKVKANQVINGSFPKYLSEKQIIARATAAIKKHEDRFDVKLPGAPDDRRM